MAKKQPLPEPARPKPRPARPSPPARVAEPARRRPRQERSRQRLATILDAAAHLFGETGFDATTMEAIAARAGTSIGSLYQFFPNKQALFEAILAEYLGQSQKVYEELIAADAAGTPWLELVDRSVDAFAALHAGNALYRAVWVNWRVAGSLFEEGERQNSDFAAGTALALARHAPQLTEQHRRIVATVMVEVQSAMLLLAGRRPVAEARALLDETKVLLRRYLAPYAASTAPRDEARAKATKKKPRK